ncbi:MAG: MerR family transcriptional regulator [Gemmatimonas sp.]
MSMMPSPDPRLDVSLEQLVALAAPLLARLSVGDQRVQSAPDARTIRYFQTTGLLDRPLRYEGRTARYGRRHLLQLVAIRTLQVQGLSLSQVQTRLTGATDSELEGIVAGTGVAPVSRGVPAPTNAVDAPIAAAEIAPGVIITIDSRMQPHSARLIERMRLAIQQMIQQETQS